MAFLLRKPGILRPFVVRAPSTRSAVSGATPDPGPSEIIDPNDPLETVAVGGAVGGNVVMERFTFGFPYDQMVAQPLYLNNPIFPNYNQKDLRQVVSAAAGINIAKGFTGREDANDGVPMTTLDDIVTFEAGVMKIRCRLTTVGERALLGSRDNSVRITGLAQPGWATFQANMSPSFGFMGPGILQIRCKIVMPNVAPWNTWVANTAQNDIASGQNFAAVGWQQSIQGGSEGVDETDEFEFLTQANGKSTTRPTDIASENGQLLYPVQNTWFILQCEFAPSGAETKVRMSILDDTFTQIPGTNILALNYDGTGASTMSNLLARIQTMLLGASVFARGNFGADASEAAWAGVQAGIDISSMRFLAAASRKRVVPPTVYAQTDRIPDRQMGNVVLSFPDKIALWGGAGSENELMTFQQVLDVNGPGNRTDKFVGWTDGVAGIAGTRPAGVTLSLVARTLTIAASTFATKPGLVKALLWAQLADTAFAKPYHINVCVDPKVMLQAFTVATPGGAYSHTIARDDGSGNRYFDAGNLAWDPTGKKGLSCVSKPAWASYDDTTRIFTGTAPSPALYMRDRATMRVTNAQAHSTDEINRFMWAPEQITKLSTQIVFDPRETDRVAGVAGDAVALMKDVYWPGRTMARTDAPTRPHLLGIDETRRLVYANQALSTTDGANGSGLATLWNAAAWNNAGNNGYVIFAVRPTALGTNRIYSWYNAAGTTFLGFRQTATGCGVSFTVLGSGNVTVQDANPDTAAHVYEIIKNGTAFSVRRDGVQIATLTLTQTGTPDWDRFYAGFTRNNGAADDAPVSAFEAGAFFASRTIPSVGDQAKLLTWAGLSLGLTL